MTLPILHVGFGKTSTSFLQEVYLPKILKIGNRFYWKEDQDITNKVLKHRDMMLCDGDIEKINLPNNILISLETLMAPSGWDPIYYETYADYNLKAFGRNCEIIITIRKPSDWLRSNYIRNIGKRNIIPESKFYVSNTNYKKYKISDRHCMSFALEKLSYNGLFEIYSKRFAKVTILKYENLLDIKTWENVLKNKIENIQEIEEAKNNIVNLALSKKAVHFTRCVNRFLGFFGLSIDKLHNFNKALRFKDSSNYIKKYYNIILNVLTWKNLIRFLDAKFFKYEKYQLNTNEFINQQIIRLQNEYDNIHEN